MWIGLYVGYNSELVRLEVAWIGVDNAFMLSLKSLFFLSSIIN